MIVYGRRRLRSEWTEECNQSSKLQLYWAGVYVVIQLIRNGRMEELLIL